MTDIRAIFAALRDALHEASPMTWPDRGFSSTPNSLVAQPDQWIQLQSRNFRDFCFHLTGYPLSTNAYCYFSLDAEVLGKQLMTSHHIANGDAWEIAIPSLACRWVGG